MFFAGLLEVLWAYSMKLSEAFIKFVPGTITVVAMIASVVLLSISMRSIPLGTAYGVWIGIGVVGAFLLGIIVLGEPLTPLRVTAAVLIVAGLVLMKFSSSH